VIPRLFSYYGGKGKIARYYPRPIYDTIIEPFAGSAGYSLRYADKHIILVEKNHKVAEVWRFLIHASPNDIRALPLLGPDDDLREMDLPDPARWFIGFWVNQATPMPCNKLSTWAKSKYKTSVHFWGMKCRARCASFVDRISHWEIIEGDYTDAPNIEATWHIDPPYQEEGKYYPEGKDLDYESLAEWCQSRQGQIMVCENAGATWLPFQFLRNIHGAARPSGWAKKSTEVIWTNEKPREGFGVFDG